MQHGQKAVWSIPCASVAYFPSLKQNFIAYRSSKVSSRPDCIFEIQQQWQSGFSMVYSNCCCSCWSESEIIKIGQSSHKLYSNNSEFSRVCDKFKCPYEKGLQTYWRYLVRAYIVLSRQCISPIPLTLTNLFPILFRQYMYLIFYPDINAYITDPKIRVRIMCSAQYICNLSYPNCRYSILSVQYMYIFPRSDNTYKYFVVQTKRIHMTLTGHYMYLLPWSDNTYTYYPYWTIPAYFMLSGQYIYLLRRLDNIIRSEQYHLVWTKE